MFTLGFRSLTNDNGYTLSLRAEENLYSASQVSNKATILWRLVESAPHVSVSQDLFDSQAL